MPTTKVFNCQNCDAELEVSNLEDRSRVACRRCGRLYRLFFIETEQAWALRAEEPVEPGVEETRREEEPFSVLGEIGRPKPVDRSEKHREQTDLTTDTDQAVDKAHRKP